jgi:tetratricopeptide (TPR) repeat protein
MMQSEWNNADELYLEAQRVFQELENHKGAAESLRNRANMAFQCGEYIKSEEFCEQALDFATEINDYELRATILNTLGAIKSATGELRESIKIFKLCLADFQTAGNKIRQGYVLLNIGLTQTELGEYANGIGSLEESLAIALDCKDLHLVEICYQNISKCYLAQKEAILAKSVIDTARKILPGLNSKSLEAELNLIDCKILRIMGNLSAAEELLETTYKMARVGHLSALEADILFEQGLLEKDKGRTEMATAKLDAAANHYRQLNIEKGFKEVIATLEQLRRSVHA